MVSENLMGKVVDEETYYLCMNEDCDVVYYNLNNERVFYKEDVKVPIWFKRMQIPNIYAIATKLQSNKL